MERPDNDFLSLPGATKGGLNGMCGITVLRKVSDGIGNYFNSFSFQNLKELCEFFGKTFFVTGVITIVGAQEFTEGIIFVIISLLFLAESFRR